MKAADEKLKNFEDPLGTPYKDYDILIAAVNARIHETKTKLKNEIGVIGNLKISTTEANTFVSMDSADVRDMLIESVQKLIALCTKYANRFSTMFSQ